MSGKAIRETVGFLAVVASLVFVGLRSSRTRRWLEGRPGRPWLDGAMEWLTLRTTDPELNDLFEGYWSEGSDLDLERGSANQPHDADVHPQARECVSPIQ